VRKIIIGVIIVALVVSGTYFALGGRAANAPTASLATAVPALKADGPMTAEGRVVPVQSVALNFSSSGVVAEVLVQEGDMVAKGTPLARLDTRDLELNIARAEASLAQAQASYDQQTAGVTPEEIAAAQAQIAQSQANLRQTRGSVTQADIVAARATLTQANAALAKLNAGPKNTQVQTAQATLDQAQANLQSQRNGLSAAKTNAELQMQQATADLTKAQAAYATARQNWQYVQDTGNDPVSPRTIGSDGKPKANKLNSTQRQQYYDTFVQAEATLHSAESAVQQAQVSFDNARQTEITGIQTAEAQVRSAQAALDQTRAGADADQIAAARAQVAQAQANLNKLLGDQRAGSLDAALAGVTSAEANLAQLTSDPRAADLAMAQAQVQAAEVSVKAAKLALEQATLLAPIAGTVAQVNLKAGETLDITHAAVILANFSVWQIETTDLTELNIGRIKLGDPAMLTFDALPGVELAGKVTKIAAIGQNKQSDIIYTVTIAPDAQDARLRWNMTVAVSITPK
jgi:HlyD family secretion protein